MHYLLAGRAIDDRVRCRSNQVRCRANAFDADRFSVKPFSVGRSIAPRHSVTRKDRHNGVRQPSLSLSAH
jgi:hypothetical protein